MAIEVDLKCEVVQDVESDIVVVSISEVNSGDMTADVLYISDDLKEGLFEYDSTDNTSIDNGATVLVDNSGRRYKRRYNGFAFAEWFGAVGDGLTDDSVAIQNALNEGSVSLEEKTYILASGIDVPDGRTLKGLGKDSVIQSDPSFTSGEVLTLGTEARVEDIKMIGDANFTRADVESNSLYPEDLTELDARKGQGNLIGILGSNQRYSINNVYFTQFSECAVETVANAINASSQPIRSDISNCTFYLNYISLHEVERSEYGTFSDNTFKYNIIGIIVEGGNNSHANNKIDHNRFNIVLEGDPFINNSHGEFTGGSCNHGKLYALVARQVQYGEMFTGMSWFDGGTYGIYIEDSKGIHMMGNTFSSMNIVATGSYNNVSDPGQNFIVHNFFRFQSDGGIYDVQVDGNTEIRYNEALDGNEEDSNWNTQFLNNSKYDNDQFYYKEVDGINTIVGYDVLDFNVGSVNVAGSLRIKAPVGLNNQFMSIELEVIGDNINCNYTVTGWALAAGWNTCTVQTKSGDTLLDVDFGSDGSGNLLLYFGPTSQLWRYEYVRIKSLKCFRGAFTRTKDLKYGWEAVITNEAHQNVDQTVTPV